MRFYACALIDGSDAEWIVQSQARLAIGAQGVQVPNLLWVVDVLLTAAIADTGN